MISQNTIQEILSKINVLEVISDFVKLKKRGANYLGNCPFHNEKTPSFTVSPSKEIYKCFGCGKSGNSISFIMEHEKYSYVEALKYLAKKFNVEIEETFVSNEQKEQFQTADSLYIINSFAEKYFTKQLFETEEGQTIGLSYLKERGFRENIIEKFHLGYASASWDHFSIEAINNHYNKDLLIKSGLIIERNGRFIDNYRERIIFPIHSNSGKIIGFGARVLKSTDKAPKYINTPENEIYIKSKILYGVYFARTAIDKTDECLLVEGYTDVVSLHQAGIENVVASGGTSLTVDQLRLIKKYTSNLTIIYDGDAAGVKAALRGLDMALEEGLNVKLVLIPDKEDPDSYVNKVGAEAFKNYIQENKKDFILFQLQFSLQEVENDSVKKSEIVNRIAESISKINRTEDFTKQQDYIRESAAILKIDEAGLLALVNKYIRDRVSVLERQQSNKQTPAIGQQPPLSEEQMTDTAFDLLYKEQLQEKEIARVLLEFGQKNWDEKQLVSEYVLNEISDIDIEDHHVIALLDELKKLLKTHPKLADKKYFIYHADNQISSFAVGLLNFPYEESTRWMEDKGQNTGYQKSLFLKSEKDFFRILAKDNDGELNQYKLISEDKTNQIVESAIHFLKLRKIRRILLLNQEDMEGVISKEKFAELHFVHHSLKQMEIEITQKLGTVILR